MKNKIIQIIPHINKGNHKLSEIEKASKIRISGNKGWKEFFRQIEAEIIDDEIIFREKSKMLASIKAIQEGEELVGISKYLDWREFEILTAELTEKHDYECLTNIVTSKPRMQIDVIAIGKSHRIVFDCKHWKKQLGPSNIRKIADNHVKRCEKYFRTTNSEDDSKIFPVILTMSIENNKIVNGVPIVSIVQLNNFLLEINSLENIIKEIK